MAEGPLTCNALVVGLEAYHTYFTHATRDLKGYVLENNGVELDFRFDFEFVARSAWRSANSRHYDLFFIDGSCDTEVRLGRDLSEALKDLYPNTPIVGMSFMGQYFRSDKEAALRYDIMVDSQGFSTKSLAKILEELGFLPQGRETREGKREEKEEKLRGDPQAGRFMDEW